jgi:hypothetical protein
VKTRIAQRATGNVFNKTGMVLLAVFVMLPFLQGRALGEEDGMKKIAVTSSAFGKGGSIPPEFTCDGADMSPPIEWSGVPANAQSLAVIVDDPDAPSGDWAHWLVYDLPPDLTQLPAGISPEEKLFVSGSQGLTDFRKLGYQGPCPPGGEHRYFFKVYALDAMLSLKPGASKQELFQAMQGHVLAEGVLMGKYTRS